MAVVKRTEHKCPICSKELRVTRYPNYICHICASRVTDEEGKPLTICNAITGEYSAEYTDTGKKYDSHICYVDGIKCYAEEARFGGIVIQIK